VNVTIDGITPDKMHLKLADIGNGGTNLPLAKAAEGNDVKIRRWMRRRRRSILVRGEVCDHAVVKARMTHGRFANVGHPVT